MPPASATLLDLIREVERLRDELVRFRNQGDVIGYDTVEYVAAAQRELDDAIRRMFGQLGRSYYFEQIKREFDALH